MKITMNLLLKLALLLGIIFAYGSIILNKDIHKTISALLALLFLFNVVYNNIEAVGLSQYMVPVGYIGFLYVFALVCAKITNNILAN